MILIDEPLQLPREPVQEFSDLIGERVYELPKRLASKLTLRSDNLLLATGEAGARAIMHEDVTIRRVTQAPVN
ncbi:hypothetical protein D4R52_02455 [bacterium]|nr:MAG: hypothetical protein D4R52_02455 [bacterium]